MKKEVLGNILEGIDGNFIIYTNIAQGRGINGVSYLSFWKEYVSYDGKEQQSNTFVFDNDVLIISSDIYYPERMRNKFEKFVYRIPYESIVMIKEIL